MSNLFPEMARDAGDETRAERKREKKGALKVNPSYFGRSTKPLWSACRKETHRVCPGAVMSQKTGALEEVRCACPCHRTKG